MPRKIDSALKGKRDSALATLAFAQNYTSMMEAKSKELQNLTHVSVGGHSIGDQLVNDASNSVSALSRAHSKLVQAIDTARAIDITVEVPE